jgi:hypothetical protein
MTNSIERDRANVEMFGVRDIQEFIRNIADNSSTYNVIGPWMVVMSMLSDAQEEMQFDSDMARKTINRAKVILSHAYAPKE